MLHTPISPFPWLTLVEGEIAHTIALWDNWFPWVLIPTYHLHHTSIFRQGTVVVKINGYASTHSQFGSIRGVQVDWRHIRHRSVANRVRLFQSFLSSSCIGSVLITLFMFILLHMILPLLVYTLKVCHLNVCLPFCLSFENLNKNIEQGKNWLLRSIFL